MKTKSLLFTAFLLAFVVISTYGQQNQGKLKNYSKADQWMLAKKVAEDPSLIDRYQAYEATLKQIQIQMKSNGLVNGSKTDTLINGRRVIPVVFHIVHKYGIENISDAQVQDAIAKLNIDYNLLNADTVDTYPMFKSRKANLQIEFRLAKIDPNGNCTNGIEHIYDPRTNYAYYDVMHDYCWTPSFYLNIFAVNFIYPEGINLPAGAFIGGMSPFPPSNPMTSALTGGDTLVNGVLIRQDCIGSIGTATNMGGMGINAENRTLTHELGHYWNLYHPFQNLMLGLLPASSGCYSFLAPNGDEVADTPWEGSAAQNTSLNCFIPGSRNSCTNDTPDEPDMVENYMDYEWGYCTNIFTLGQKDRIDATLLGDRLKLWSIENLTATGVLDPNPSACAPIADFNVDYKMICAGSTVHFADFSYNGATTDWEWTFAGGTPATSTSQNPSVAYNTPGTYQVKLKASNAAGSDSLVKLAMMIVSDPATAQDAPYLEGFEGSMSSYLIYNPAGNGWEVTDSAKYSGTKCFRVASFSNNATTSIDELITPAIDLTALSPAPTSLSMKFKLAYTGKTSTNPLTQVTDSLFEALKVLISTDCGKTWTPRYSKTGMNLTTAPLSTVSFFPASTAEWREESVNLNPYLTNSSVRFKFQVVSGGGNNLYIDDINITSTASIEEDILSALNLNIIPNPMNQSAEISFNLNKSENISVEVLDIVGQNVVTLGNETMSAGIHSLTMTKQQLGAAGFYFVKITVGNVSQIKKVIVN